MQANISLKVEVRDSGRIVSDPKLLAEQVVDSQGIWQCKGILGKIKNENREKKRKAMMKAKFLFF